MGKRLAGDLELPFFSKDFFKEALFDQIGWQDRAWSQKLGGASVQLLFRCAAALLEVGQSVALESNFYPRWDTEPLQALHERYGCRLVQVLCMAPGPLLVERYEQRALSGARHPGHVDPPRLDEIRPILLGEPWPALPLDGPLLTVDTSNFEAIDYADVLRRCRLAAE